MNIALNEARETKYWLQLISKSIHFELNVSQEINEIESIIRILSSIVKTTKNKLEEK